MDAADSLEERLRRVGLALGLDAVGFAPATPSERTRFLRDWVARGYSGEMHYIARRLEQRVDPRKVLESARSIVVVALACPEVPSGVPRDAGVGRIARFAGGDDYHDVLLDRVRALEAALPVMAGTAVRSRSYVDTGPVAERAAAERAGLGWIAKNSCLIHPELGSHLMLGVILTDLTLASDERVADHCGTCRACLEACPSDAFPEPHVLDARRCIAYTTVELRGSIPDSLRRAQGDHVFGCDVCQNVCPWNRSRPRAPLADPLGLRSRLTSRQEWLAPTLEWILSLSPEAFGEATRKSALRRAGHRGLMRNALVAAGNARSVELRSLVMAFVEGDDELLREHAHWALAQIDAD